MREFDKEDMLNFGYYMFRFGQDSNKDAGANMHACFDNWAENTQKELDLKKVGVSLENYLQEVEPPRCPGENYAGK